MEVVERDAIGEEEKYREIEGYCMALPQNFEKVHSDKAELGK